MISIVVKNRLTVGLCLKGRPRQFLTKFYIIVNLSVSDQRSSSGPKQGLVARFGGEGLRLVEVHRDELMQLPEVLQAIRRDGGRHRFLIFADDLSFGPGEPGYRELKAALEGSLDGPPAAVRIVATSNRRHLLPESMQDNRGARVDEQGELHLGEALDEL